MTAKNAEARSGKRTKHAQNERKSGKQNPNRIDKSTAIEYNDPAAFFTSFFFFFLVQRMICRQCAPRYACLLCALVAPRSRPKSTHTNTERSEWTGQNILTAITLTFSFSRARSIHEFINSFFSLRAEHTTRNAVLLVRLLPCTLYVFIRIHARGDRKIVWTQTDCFRCVPEHPFYASSVQTMCFGVFPCNPKHMNARVRALFSVECECWAIYIKQNFYLYVLLLFKWNMQQNTFCVCSSSSSSWYNNQCTRCRSLHG